MKKQQKLRIVGLITSLVLTSSSLWIGCATNSAEPTKESSKSSIAAAQDEKRDSETKDRTMQVEKDNPRAIEIMRKDCENGYDVLNLDSTKNKPQAEAGISMPIDQRGKKAGKVKPFIYYRCRSGSVK